MFSIFSNKQKVSERLRQLQHEAGAQYTRVLLAGQEEEPLWMLKPGFLPLLIWINTNILFVLPNIEIKTLDVRLRIATGMLNNLVKDKIVTKEMAIIYHERLVTTSRKIFNEIMIEDIPF